MLIITLSDLPPYSAGSQRTWRNVRGTSEDVPAKQAAFRSGMPPNTLRLLFWSYLDPFPDGKIEIKMANLCVWLWTKTSKYFYMMSGRVELFPPADKTFEVWGGTGLWWPWSLFLTWRGLVQQWKVSFPPSMVFLELPCQVPYPMRMKQLLIIPGEKGDRCRYYTSIYGNSLGMSLTFELTMSLDCLRKGDIFPHLEFGTRS